MVGKKPERFGGGWHNENNILSQSRKQRKKREKKKRKLSSSYSRAVWHWSFSLSRELRFRHESTIPRSLRFIRIPATSRIHRHASPSRVYITFANLRGDLRGLKEMCDVALCPHNALLNTVGRLYSCLYSVSLRYVWILCLCTFDVRDRVWMYVCYVAAQALFNLGGFSIWLRGAYISYIYV